MADSMQTDRISRENLAGLAEREISPPPRGDITTAAVGGDVASAAAPTDTDDDGGGILSQSKSAQGAWSVDGQPHPADVGGGGAKVYCEPLQINWDYFAPSPRVEPEPEPEPVGEPGELALPLPAGDTGEITTW